MTAQGLLELLKDLKFIEGLMGWLISNFADSWPWYQHLTSQGRRIWMAVFCFVIATISTIVYFFAFGGDVPLIDSIANLIYAWGATFLASGINYVRVKSNEAKAIGG